MNRTDRLYALVEELRASAPSSRTAKEMAARFEVSTRTVERDILALQEAGVPIRGAAGRRGGYFIDPQGTLPPINFTPAEALAVAIALADGSGPFAAAGRQASLKVLAAMGEDARVEAKEMSARVRRYRRPRTRDRAEVSMPVQQAIAEGFVVEVDYMDRHGMLSTRAIEPVGVMSLDDDWYLVGWCRLRDEARRFRVDRILTARCTDEVAPWRDPERFLEFMPWLVERAAPIG